MALSIILLICVIILAVIVALEFHTIQVLLDDHDDVMQIADETNNNALEALNHANEVLKHTKAMIALTEQVNDHNKKLIEMLDEAEKKNGKTN